MTRLLAALDDSAAATPVLQMALALSGLLGGEVSAVQVGEAAGLTAHAAADALAVPFTTVPGEPVAELLRLAAEPDVVAVVVGLRDRPTSPHAAGHVALSLAAGLDKPVVVVPPDANPPSQVRRVLVAMAGTARDARGLAMTIELSAAAEELDLLVVHVEDEDSLPSFSDQVQYEGDAYANEFLARYCLGAPTATLRLRFGIPVEEILATVGEVEPDLLAIGWPRTPDSTRGAVARELLQRTRVPLLIAALAPPSP